MSEPATAVFKMLQAARELKLKEQAEFMHELVGIAATPSQSRDYIRGLQAHYQKMSDNAVPEHSSFQRKPKGATVPWEIATAQMTAAMKLKKKLEHRGQRKG